MIKIEDLDDVEGITSIVYTEEEIQKAIKSMAIELNAHYKDAPVTVIPLLEGSLMFAGRLITLLTFPVRVSTMKVHRYDREEGKEIQLTGDVPQVLQDNVLIVDDIIDEGITLQKVSAMLEYFNTNIDITTCCLFNKQGIDREIEADFSGIPVDRDAFIFGFGLDYNGKYRNLPYVVKATKDKKEGDAT